ncbi:hypothetical protein GBA65_21190 (plasmid) [Rubrobacter marinus]|uniref:Uncharacterized protein n=1 Tax=Rubrobacter marinus TaxID=2653852 RepID=A0A6G8Q3E3_9ACTN|nr:hypothetical protein [Rubrobacter marinus]QIN80976.1 hypothetical protein GBA65_21190 [Rubrobacter marinus]
MDRVVGASVVHPKGLVVEREKFKEDGTYGFTLWRPASGASRGHGGGRRGGSPWLASRSLTTSSPRT